MGNYWKYEKGTETKFVITRGKKLNDESVATMIKGTATRPEVRRRKIIEGLQRNNSIYKNNPFTTEFGISFEDTLTRIQGRLDNFFITENCLAKIYLNIQYISIFYICFLIKMEILVGQSGWKENKGGGNIYLI